MNVEARVRSLDRKHSDPPTNRNNSPHPRCSSAAEEVEAILAALTSQAASQTPDRQRLRPCVQQDSCGPSRSAIAMARCPQGTSWAHAVAIRWIKTRKIENKIPRSAALSVRSAWLPQHVGQFVNNRSDPAGAGRPATVLTPSASHPPNRAAYCASATDLH